MQSEYLKHYNSLSKLVNLYRNIPSSDERYECYDAMQCAFNGFNRQFGTSLCWIPLYEKIEKEYADKAINYQI